MSVKRIKPVAPQTCAFNVHRDELFSLIRSVQSAASYPESKSRFHTPDLIRCCYKRYFG
jgi:hypothetical protein